MRVQSVKLHGSVQTIFELWCLLLILAICGLIAEICLRKTPKFPINFSYWLTQMVLKEV